MMPRKSLFAESAEYLPVRRLNLKSIVKIMVTAHGGELTGLSANCLVRTSANFAVYIMLPLHKMGLLFR